MSAAVPRHPVVDAATAAAARLTSAAADAKYRTPAFIDNMLKTGGYRIFVVLTHGELVPNSGGPGFVVPPNTFVLQTGARETFSCMTSTDFDRIYLPRFFGKEINKTFHRFIGMEGSSINTTLSPFLFNTPGEEALDKYIYLGNEDLRKTDSFWGVFHIDTAKKSLSDDPDPDLTSYLNTVTEKSGNDFYKQSDFTTVINTVYPPSDKTINILMFVNCVVAPKDKGFNAKDYSRAMNIAGRMTHHGAPKDAAKVAAAAQTAAAALTEATARSIGAGPYGPAVGIAYGAAAAAGAATGTSKFNTTTGARILPKGAAVPASKRAPADTSRTEFGRPLPRNIFEKHPNDWRFTNIEGAVLAKHGMAPVPAAIKPSTISIGVGPTGAKPPAGAKSGKGGKKPRAGGRRRTRKHRK
jgi:hypothetical protein